MKEIFQFKFKNYNIFWKLKKEWIYACLCEKIKNKKLVFAHSIKYQMDSATKMNICHR